ncbi:hypothetical protein AA0Y32_06590 [Georgenia phoenicis]|uniref:hypothetical protein n=1 Tax=unclassified Georgenia TaxID=2626815 RepID=UPI0039B0EC75
MSRVGAVRTRGYQVFLVAVAVLFAGATLMGVYDPELPGAGRWEAIPVGFMVGAVALATRACALGVTVREETVVVRNLEWTHRLSRADVVAVRVVNYDGRLGGSSWPSWWWTTVRLTLTSGREVTAYGLLGRRAVVARHAARLRELVGLPEPTPRTSHRAARRTSRG